MNAVKTTHLLLAVLSMSFASTGALDEFQYIPSLAKRSSGCYGPKGGKCINEAVCLKLNGVVNGVCQNPVNHTKEVCCSFPEYLQSTLLVVAGPQCEEPEGVPNIAKCINEAMCLELDGVVNGTCHNPGYTSKAVCCTVKSEREYKGIGINDDLNKILAFKYVNPNFPGGLNETSKHHFRFKKVSKNVTQLRLDFVTFNLALPNETTKICTEDVMIISHGSSKQLKICGSYSDKHIYYNLDDEKEDLIFINITLLKKNFYRDWEIKVTQLMEHQKVPDTCLQFFEEVTGKVQMTNITLNGRDLNNGKNNRICILHKPHMCSITYQPCIKHVIKPQPDSFLNGKTIQFGLNLWEEIVDDNTGFCQDYQQKICRYRP